VEIRNIFGKSGKEGPIRNQKCDYFHKTFLKKDKFSYQIALTHYLIGNYPEFY
jgi:hypothetical protein